MVDRSAQLVGLLVDSVSDLVVLPRAKLQPAPHVGDDPANAFIAASVALDGRILSVLRLDSIIPELHSAAA